MKTRLRHALLGVVVAALVLALIEGVASCGFFVYRWVMSAESPLAERVHTRYDPELGWVSIPGRRFPDLYGPGATLTTNARGFRGTKETERRVPAGKLRIVCSGDSFTLGYGVDDSETWCRALELLDPRLETVNMGQGGYGLDQAYLWYRRDGAALDHDVHLLSFIVEDFERLRFDSFRGYGKPILRLEDGILAVGNVPVPRRAYSLPWLAQNTRILYELKSARLLAAVLNGLGMGGARREAASVEDGDRLALAIFESLQRANQEKNSTLVLVYIPLKQEYTADAWVRGFLAAEAARRRIPFFDLTPDFRVLSREEIEDVYIGEGTARRPGAEGHLSPRGNRWVARLLWERLQTVPALRSRLATATRSGAEASPLADPTAR